MPHQEDVTFKSGAFKLTGVVNIPDGLKAGEWDLTFFGPTPERERVLNFTAPFLVIEHGYLVPDIKENCEATDRPSAALITDLKQRGLLEDTLVWWGGEFGRNPFAENNGTGRDHNPNGFTVWLAGGGVKAGYSYGATDEFGHMAVEQKIHMHDLHATILPLLGLDHKQLTYRYAGRDFRLTDVHGKVVDALIG